MPQRYKDNLKRGKKSEKKQEFYSRSTFSVTTERRPLGITTRLKRELQLGGEGVAAGWRGRRSWVEREMQPGGEGERLGADGWTSGQAVTPPCALSSRTGRMENQLICVCISDYAVYISLSCRMV